MSRKRSCATRCSSFRLKLHGTCVHSLFEGGLVGFEHSHGCLCILVVAYGSHFRLLLKLCLNGFEVFELEFGVNHFLVLHGIHHCSTLTHDVVVVEAAQHMYDGIGLTNVAEELVAESFALACALHESCNIDDFARCRHDASRVYYLGELCEPPVGHGDDAHVRLYGAKRKVGCLRLGVGETVEESGLSTLGSPTIPHLSDISLYFNEAWGCWPCHVMILN